MSDLVYLRDIDGTGSLHPCLKGDPGAIAFVPLSDVRAVEDELNDVITIAENFTDLATCPGGRTVNASSGGYTCFLCGADLTTTRKCGNPKASR